MKSHQAYGQGHDHGRGYDQGRGYDHGPGHDQGRGFGHGPGHDQGRGYDHGRGHDHDHGQGHASVPASSYFYLKNPGSYVSMSDFDQDIPEVDPGTLFPPPGTLLNNKHQVPVTTEEAQEYLDRILKSKVYDDGVAIRTPLQLAVRIKEKTKYNFWLKREDKQPAYSFKLRGAYNMMSNLPKEELEKKVIAASSGNHAQGVALAAQKLKQYAVIAMPITAAKIKVDAVKRIGGEYVEVVQKKEWYRFDQAEKYAQEQANTGKYVYVPPSEAYDVIYGQGTIGMEILNESTIPTIDAVFVPIGGGGLISGISAYIKSVNPNVKVIGVEPYGANAMALSLDRNQRIMLANVDTFADGVAVKAIGDKTFTMSKKLIDGVVLVSKESICGAIKDVYEEDRTIVEVAGAVALAGAQSYCNNPKNGVKEGANIVVIMTGANMDFDLLPKVATLAEVGRLREGLLATVLPDRPGSFKHFAEQVGSLNITKLKYRYDPNKQNVPVLYGVSISHASELDELLKRMDSARFQTVNLSGNDLVTDHLMNMVGGTDSIEDETLFRLALPEKPGMLNEFLDALDSRWNITMFNYQKEGDITASVLAGFQVPGYEMDEFWQRVDNLGYEYKTQPVNKGFNLLLNA